jgi:hypothetical protein
MSSPSIGRIVHYTLNEVDARNISHPRQQAQGNGYAGIGIQIHNGNPVKEGDVFPAVVVRDWGGSVNLKVLLDGDDTYWATSRSEGEDAGTWAWPQQTEQTEG